MNSVAVLLLCIQACLVQNVLSQCSCGGPAMASIAPAAFSSGHGCDSVTELGYGIGGAGLIGNAGGLAHGASSAAAYGGVGEGNVAVIGELPVSGNTAVIGHVPILGAVSFGGNVQAAGSVCINGKCACGCGN